MLTLRHASYDKDRINARGDSKLICYVKVLPGHTLPREEITSSVNTATNFMSIHFL